MSLIQSVSTSSNETQRAPVVFVLGPTAAGKTSLAVELASQFPFEVISVDAAQVYRGMNIGTAKPSARVLERVPHRLIDICDPWERYSAGRFRSDALKEIRRIFLSGRIPLLVGGAMFYFRALERGLSDLPVSSKAFSTQLRQRAAVEGWPTLHQELMSIDPKSGRKVSPNDSQRIGRLLEMYYSAGRVPSRMMQDNGAKPFPFKIVKIAIVRSDRQSQKAVIEQRFHEMLDQGFVQEAEKLFTSSQFDITLPAMRSVGYKQIWQYLLDNVGYEEMVESAVRATCGVAKRQLTWIRNSSGVIWTVGDSSKSKDRVHRLLECILNR